MSIPSGDVLIQFIVGIAHLMKITQTRPEAVGSGAGVGVISGDPTTKAQYEDEYMDILPLREKTPLIRYIEDYFYARNMKQKEGAKLLGINESVFSQILSGKRRSTMPIAKRLHTKLGINAE